MYLSQRTHHKIAQNYDGAMIDSMAEQMGFLEILKSDSLILTGQIAQECFRLFLTLGHDTYYSIVLDFHFF
jgi:hypothetical protein